MPKTVLLTGATGFLGSHILKRLLAQNYHVVILKRSFSNTWRIKEHIHQVTYYNLDEIQTLKVPYKENQIDVVIHTATNYGRSGEKTTEIVKTNLNFSLELLEAATFFKTTTFINTDSLQYDYLNDYTLSKKQFTEWGKHFASASKINFINLKVEHMYGPKDDENKFVPWLIQQLMNNVSEIKLTAGTQKRDFVYVEDVVNAYMTMLKLKGNTGFEEYEVGTGVPTPLKDFILKIYKTIEVNKREKLTTNLEFGALPIRKGEPKELKANINKLLNLGWKPEIDMNVGVIKTIRSK